MIIIKIIFLTGICINAFEPALMAFEYAVIHSLTENCSSGPDPKNSPEQHNWFRCRSPILSLLEWWELLCDWFGFLGFFGGEE